MTTQNNELAVFDPLKAEVTLFVAPISQIIIKDTDSNLMASMHLKKIQEMRKTLEARRKEHTQPLVERQRAIIAYCDEIDAPLEAAKKSILDKQKAWNAIVQKQLDDDRRKAEEARREEERKAAAERTRIEAEAKAKYEAEARAICEEQDRQRRELEAKRLEELEALKACGVDPEAERIAAEAEAKAMAERQEQARIAAAKQAEADRLADQARFNREEKERQAEANRRMKELEAARPKNMTTEQYFEVVDIKAVPSEYLLLNEVAARKAMFAGIAVPGIKFGTRQKVVAR